MSMLVLAINKKQKLKKLIKYVGLYAGLMGIIYGLRYFRGLGMDWDYYVKMAIILLSLVTTFSFLEPKHIEKLLPKNSRISLIITLMLRFMPVVNTKIQNIKHNQEMRGVKYKGIGQMRHNISILLPSLVVALIWSNNIAESIKMRGGS